VKAIILSTLIIYHNSEKNPTYYFPRTKKNPVLWDDVRKFWCGGRGTARGEPCPHIYKQAACAVLNCQCDYRIFSAWIQLFMTNAWQRMINSPSTISLR